MYYLIRVKDGGGGSMIGSFDLPDDNAFDHDMQLILTRKQTKDVKAKPKKFFRPLINDFLRKMAKFRHQENQDVSAGTRIRFFIDKPAAMISFPRAVIKYL